MNAKKATNILVTVDTSKINGSSDVDKHVIFTDDNGNSTGKPGNSREFTSKVEKNKWVNWRGQAKGGKPTDSVEILDVQRKPKNGGSEILLFTRIEDGMVTGKIKDKNVQGEELYDLTFRINADAQKTYTVDPKLKML